MKNESLTYITLRDSLLPSNGPKTVLTHPMRLLLSVQKSSMLYREVSCHQYKTSPHYGSKTMLCIQYITLQRLCHMRLPHTLTRICTHTSFTS